MKRGLLILSFFILIIFITPSFLSEGSDSSSTSEWLMYGRTLNHTNWDGNNFTVISGLVYATFNYSHHSLSTPVVANGYVYLGGSTVLQLNASNVSQYITNFTKSGTLSFSSPAVANGYVYVGDVGPTNRYIYQLNASNVSQQIASYSSAIASLGFSAPVIANGYLYIGNSQPDITLYQLNASNISQQIATYTGDGSSNFNPPTVANGYVYASTANSTIYQLNASNISQQIANYTAIPSQGQGGGSTFSSSAVTKNYLYIASAQLGTVYQLNASNISQQISKFSSPNFYYFYSSPAVANGYVYIGCDDKNFYQLNASNISQQIANHTFDYSIRSSPTVSSKYVYVVGNYGIFTQLNASDISQQFISSYSIDNFTGSADSSSALAMSYIYIASGSGILYQLNANWICPEIWGCTPWSVCSNGKQTRTCTEDKTLCATSGNKPAESQSCTIADLGGHIVPTLDSAGGGGGGGGVSFYSNITNITPEKPVEITINNPNMDLNSLVLNVKKDIQNSSATIKKLSYNETRLITGLPIGRLYQAFEIEPGINNTNIINATLNFRINKTWLAENNITFHSKGSRFWLLEGNIVGNIILYRNPDGANAWLPLTTSYSYQDNESYHFYAYSKGFSTFAIFLNKYDCLPNSARCDNSEVQVCLGNSTWLVTEHCTYGCQGRVCSTGFFQSEQFKFLSGVIIIAVIIIGLILIFYKKIKRKGKVKLSRKERKEIRKQKKKMKKEIKKYGRRIKKESRKNKNIRVRRVRIKRK